MKALATLALLGLLATGWQAAAADLGALHSLEVAELHRTLDPALIAELDASPQLAARAALAIGRTKQAAGADPLRAHLSSKSVAVRAMCAYALGLLGDGGSLSVLRDIIRKDAPADGAVQYAAVDAIGRILAANPSLATRDVADDILALARRPNAEPELRGHAVIQLDAFKAAAFAPQIARALESVVQTERDVSRQVPTRDVRWHAAWMLFRSYASVADAAFLNRIVHDKDEFVRDEAVRAWGRRTDDSTAVAVVSKALNDPSWHVQLSARESLRRLTKQAPTEHLTEDPPGLHLPPLPSPGEKLQPPAESAAPSPSPLAAPDPATFPLEDPAFPAHARDMDFPRNSGHPQVVLRTTKGDVTIRLYREWAPSTVANFLQLVHRHYFDGNRWFRIVPDFVVQTGDATNTGDGDPGYVIPAEENPVEQRAGVVAMGLNYTDGKAVRDSAASQFYITLSPQLHLDRDFTVFGETGDLNVLAHLVESDKIVTAFEIDPTS